MVHGILASEPEMICETWIYADRVTNSLRYGGTECSDVEVVDGLLDLGFCEQHMLFDCSRQLWSHHTDTGSGSDSPLGSYFIMASFSPILGLVVV